MKTIILKVLLKLTATSSPSRIAWQGAVPPLLALRSGVSLTCRSLRGLPIGVLGFADRAAPPKHLGALALTCIAVACELPVSPDVGQNHEVFRQSDPPNVLVQETVTLQGQRIWLAGKQPVCVVENSVTLRQGEAHTEWVSEFDPVTCEMTIRRGTKPGLIEEVSRIRDRSVALASGEALDTDLTVRIVKRTVGHQPGRINDANVLGFSGPACWDQPDGQSNAVQTTWFQDSTGTHANSTVQDLNWYWSARCVTYARAAFVGRMQRSDGWGLVSESSDLQIRNSPESYVAATGRASFYNRAFCPAHVTGRAVTATYARNDINGFTSGDAVFKDRKYVTGNCTNLLAGRTSRIHVR